MRSLFEYRHFYPAVLPDDAAGAWFTVYDNRESGAASGVAVAVFANERDAEEYIRWRASLINARIGA